MNVGNLNLSKIPLVQIYLGFNSYRMFLLQVFRLIQNILSLQVNLHMMAIVTFHPITEHRWKQNLKYHVMGGNHLLAR